MAVAARVAAVAALAAALAAAVVPAAAAEERLLPVPTVTIYPGDVIRENMIEERRFPQRLRSRFPTVDSPLAVLGKVARRTLVPGEPIPSNAVDEPKVVLRGVPAQVVFQEGGLTITGMGAPLQSAGVGEFVQVRSVDSNRIIYGIVQADGKIRIGLP